MVAATEGPYFPDWEFLALFGLDRDEVTAIVRAWASADDGDRRVQLAVNNTFNNLLGYPHSAHAELERLYAKWRGDGTLRRSTR